MHFVGHRVVFKVALCPIQWFTFAVKLVQFRRESGIIPPKYSKRKDLLNWIKKIQPEYLDANKSYYRIVVEYLELLKTE